MQESVEFLSNEVSRLVQNKVRDIQAITRMSKILAMNALIQAAHAGEHGKGFTVVAEEVVSISEQINVLSDALHEELQGKVCELEQTGKNLRGSRLADLALNIIDITDRNLYERSCDVRWWATDSAVVEVLGSPSKSSAVFASKRLGVILDSYTVYLDLWVADRHGNIVVNGRPGVFPKAVHQNVSSTKWFKDALNTTDGSRYAVGDIERNAGLGARSVATYATAIRAGGENRGEVLGVLGIFFDWEEQSKVIVQSVRLSDEEKKDTRCLILDSKLRVIASSDGKGILSEQFALEGKGQSIGHYISRNGGVVGYAQTPGYESYRGLGWYGVITQPLN